MRSLKLDLLIAFGLLALAITLSSCAAPADPPGLANTSWKLESYGPKGAETPALDGNPVTLTFEDESKAGGSGGCNSYGGQYAVKDGALSFGRVFSTMMACVDQNAMQQETDFLSALNSAGSYRLNGDRLSIEYGSGQGVLNFVKQASS